MAAPARNALARSPKPPICVIAPIDPERASIPSGLVTYTYSRSASAPVICPGVTANDTTVTADETT